jgi:hypothetical protein
MAKKSDPFDKFREATLGGGSPLSGALQGASLRKEERLTEEAPLPSPVKKSKNANRKLVSFHIDTDVFLKLGQLKFEMGTKYDDLYNEAVRDLLVKYGKL